MCRILLTIHTSAQSFSESQCFTGDWAELGWTMGHQWEPIDSAGLVGWSEIASELDLSWPTFDNVMQYSSQPQGGGGSLCSSSLSVYVNCESFIVKQTAVFIPYLFFVLFIFLAETHLHFVGKMLSRCRIYCRHCQCSTRRCCPLQTNKHTHTHTTHIQRELTNMFIGKIVKKSDIEAVCT